MEQKNLLTMLLKSLFNKKPTYNAFKKLIQLTKKNSLLCVVSIAQAVNFPLNLPSSLRHHQTGTFVIQEISVHYQLTVYPAITQKEDILVRIGIDLIFKTKFISLLA